MRDSMTDNAASTARLMLVCLTILIAITAPVLADSPESTVQYGFLTVDYADFDTVRKPGGVDLVYVAPGTFEKLGDYSGIMVDQPEVWIDAESGYRGEKPDNLKALADLVRDTLIGELIRGGYDIVEIPGPDVVYFRIALTNLYMIEHERRPTVYTPVSGGDATANELIREMLKEVDIIEMAVQAELLDSATEEVLGALVIHRGKRQPDGEPEEQMNLAEFHGIISDYGARIRCRFDNGKLEKHEWVDCARLHAGDRMFE